VTTISNFSVANHTYGDAPFSLSATSNFGTPTYSVMMGPATISGSTVTLTGAGTVIVQASVAATSTYTAATQTVTFAVAAAVPTIVFTVASHTYGDAPFLLSATSSFGTPTYSVVMGPATISGSTVTLTGAGTVAVQASVAATSSYTAATQTATFTVNKGTPTIALMTTANSVLLQSSVTLTAAVSSSALTAPTGTVAFMQGTTMLGTTPSPITNGSATYTTSSLPAGADPITAVYSGDTNFVTVTSSALTETVETFALAVPSGGTTTQTVSPGGTATYTFNVAPTYGATFLDPVSFSASGLPGGATYTFSPQTIAAGSGTTTVALTIQVSSQTAELVRPSPPGRDTGDRPLLVLGLLVLPFAGAVKTFDRRKATRFYWTLLLMLGSATFLVGCGGGSGGGSNSSTTSQQPQTYTITVTGTSGSLTATTTVTLTVQ